MTAPIRIVLADDHAIVRAGIRALVEAQPGLVVAGEAADGEEAWRHACDLMPDVLLLDLSMPGLDSVEAAARVVRDCPAVRILVLTMHEERSYVARLLEVGAAGYLLKRTAPQELVRAIHAVAAGERYLDPALANAASSGGGSATERVSGREGPDAQDAAAALTAQQVDILRRVARGSSNAEIAEALALDVADVEAQKAAAMRELGLHSRAALVRYAIAQGWRE